MVVSSSGENAIYRKRRGRIETAIDPAMGEVDRVQGPAARSNHRDGLEFPAATTTNTSTTMITHRSTWWEGSAVRAERRRGCRAGARGPPPACAARSMRSYAPRDLSFHRDRGGHYIHRKKGKPESCCRGSKDTTSHHGGASSSLVFHVAQMPPQSLPAE